MVFWFFRKKQNDFHNHLQKINENMHSSFSNIKEDIHQISKWVTFFNSKHADHDKKFQMLYGRVKEIEEILEEIKQNSKNVQIKEISVKKDVEEDEPPFFSDYSWDSLTETQQKICWTLALLQKEQPDQWITLKYLARELYPDKDYEQIRSTLSQFISTLEEFGYVKRRRKGRQAYIFSTKQNPCTDKKVFLVNKARINKKKVQKDE